MKTTHKPSVQLGLIAIHLITIIVLGFTSCTESNSELHYAIKAAGDNKGELKAVLKHYSTIDHDSEKLKAAKYLISNMPAHYSYSDTALINNYYRTAITILGTGPSPDWQRDTLRTISDRDYDGVQNRIVSDINIISSEYLIYSIDHAFEQWRTKPWAKQLTFEEFCEWLLPYKVVDLQSLDAWRDTLYSYYSDSLRSIPKSDVQRNSIYGAIEIVRNEIHTKQSAIGHRVLWEDRNGIPLRSAETWVRMTYGSCLDYVTMGTAVFRSMGLPATVDYVPAWGRNSDGHSWYVFPSDRGKETPTMNSLIIGAGFSFYPYERIPKVWRKTYTINRDRVKYRNSAKYIHPFDLCVEDVTDHYCRTSDIEIPIDKSVKLKDKYVYIAMAVNAGGPQWNILDVGYMRHGKACFKNMGRNMLYIALGYNGHSLVPISTPFILHKDGSVELLQGTADNSPSLQAVDTLNDNNSSLRGGVRSAKRQSLSVDIRRKYYESYNVVDMRRRILGAQIQCADRPDFSDAHTLYTIDTTAIPHQIPLNCHEPHRYWRYLAADGTYGSISELSFYDNAGNELTGRGIAYHAADSDAIERAFDKNLLTNFETDSINGNWVGMDMGKPIVVPSFSVSPRSDDNDVCPSNEYELFWFDGHTWQSLGYRKADNTFLHYDNVPINTLLWLRNYTRGNNERPFIIDENAEIEWW